jgi:hypothetical protein
MLTPQANSLLISRLSCEFYNDIDISLKQIKLETTDTNLNVYTHVADPAACSAIGTCG